MGRPAAAPHRRSVWARTIAAAGFVLALSTLAASPASAQATLIAANPAPGATLPEAPGAVVLHFSEAVDHARSTITATGPGGRDATVGRTQPLPTDGRTRRRPLGS